MRESLAGRVGRIVSSGAHALVDAIEDTAPEAVLQESLRDIDTVIGEVRAELGSVIAHKHRASNRLMEENDRHEELSSKIDIAVAGDSDDLASVAIEFQLDIEAQIPVLEATIGECARREAELERYISALQARRREMKNELSVFIKERHKGAAGATMYTEAHTDVIGHSNAQADARVAQAEAVFSDVMERSTDLAGHTRADARTATQLAELDDLARKSRVAERLAAVKQAAVKQAAVNQGGV